MTGPEHYREAERLLGLATDPQSTNPFLQAQAAQVHATLALAAATAVAAPVEDEPDSGMPPADATAWYQAVGVTQQKGDQR
jgi:hypothetical protein